jgi:hypothetical protein
MPSAGSREQSVGVIASTWPHITNLGQRVSPRWGRRPGPAAMADHHLSCPMAYRLLGMARRRLHRKMRRARPRTPCACDPSVLPSRPCWPA